MEIEIKPHSVPAAIIEEAQRGSRLGGTGAYSPAMTTAEPPLTMYEELKGEPYTIKYFGLQDWLFFINNPELDVSGLGTKVKAMEKFVINEIKNKNLYDSPESYRAIMRQIKEKLNITPLDRSDLIFDKILSFIKKYRGRTAYGK